MKAYQNYGDEPCKLPIDLVLLKNRRCLLKKDI